MHSPIAFLFPGQGSEAVGMGHEPVQQVVSPVRWQECIEALACQGCTQALEVGPGRLLTALVKRIAASIRCTPAEDLGAVARALETNG